MKKRSKQNPIRVPTEAEWGDYLADLDQEYAHKMFAGRTNQEISKFYTFAFWDDWERPML